ncbi:MAG: alpha amylase C-terminal domain-containing protein [Bacteroidales bacterium]
MKKRKLRILTKDKWLMPFADTIQGRHDDVLKKESELTNDGMMSLSDFANGYKYFGLQQTKSGWVFREWAPNATAIYIIGTFNDWLEAEKYKLTNIGNGIWEVKLPRIAMSHGDLYKLKVKWDGGEAERIPAYATRVIQDTQTNIFSAEVWAPKSPYQPKCKRFKPKTDPIMIYECHIGMGQEFEGYGTYAEFREKVLPRVARGGYNTIQIMAIQEHPYYGSFGYHVSNFFAASSKFGTPDELKELIDAAHSMGIAVIMDIVHSHAVKNEAEGLGRFDGSYNQYFYADGRREHPAWDSLCFDYGRNEVLHFLLSNCKFWINEYGFDGYRFDGVTSMLYLNHGLGQSFNGYEDYYNGGQDLNAIIYLTLANKLIHEINKNAITVGEEMSGMPGLASKVEHGGIGFDYRMAMGIPDYWIKMIKEKKDEDWHPTSIFWELTNRRKDEKTISYAESHDQALVGDKTIIFRLIDANMYWHMMDGDNDFMVDRGMALHKIIRLVTSSTINGGYLNFMGNEFGHPEWIDFPREGNGWSYKYAQRQWSLAEREDLKYKYLDRFDIDMVNLIVGVKKFQSLPIEKLWDNDGDQVLAYKRGDLIFVYNLNPAKSFTDYGFLAPEGSYEVVLSTDSLKYGGRGDVDETIEHFTNHDTLYAEHSLGWLKLYLPVRSAIVLRARK